MRCLVLVALVTGALASRDEMLETNRIPSEAAAAFGDTCGECKSLVHRFVEAIDDPQKLAELKLLLGALCHETSYAEECKIIVSKIDVIIKRLEPYLRDADAVCKKMHLCQNPKLTTFHRLGLLYAKQAMNNVDGTNDFVCDECQIAAIEFKKVVDDQAQRTAIKQFISQNVCKHIPKYQGACDLMLEEFLPEFWQELDALLTNPKKACSQLGFCAASAGRKNKIAPVSPKQTMKGFWKKSHYLATSKGTVRLSCFECKLIFDGILGDLRTPKNEQELSDDLRNGACPQLPPSMFDGCEDFVGMYGPTVVHMTLLQLDSEQICQDLKLCDLNSLMNMNQLSTSEKDGLKCEACRAFSAFLHYELSLPDFKGDLVAGFKQTVCSRAKAFSNLCENLAESYVPLMVDKVVAKLGSDVCSTVVGVC